MILAGAIYEVLGERGGGGDTERVALLSGPAGLNLEDELRSYQDAQPDWSWHGYVRWLTERRNCWQLRVDGGICLPD